MSAITTSAPAWPSVSASARPSPREPPVTSATRPDRSISSAILAHHDAMRRDLPSGTVTFLFTDVEGSTKLLHELGAEAYARALGEHRRILREARRRRIRYRGGCVLRRFLDGAGCATGGRRGTGRTCSGSDPGAHGHPYRNAARG